MNTHPRMMWFALVFCLWLVLLVPVTFATPIPFARINLDYPQEIRNMCVSTIDVTDLMDLSQSRVSLHSTTGDGSDTKVIPLPSIQTVTRVFSDRVAFCNDYTLTILGPLNSTVSVSGFNEYPVFIRSYLPVVQCQVPGATADVVMAKINGSTSQVDISDLISSTDIAYLLQDPRGVLAFQQHPQVIGVYGSWTSADYSPSNLTYTFIHNQFDITNYTLNRGIARSVSNLTPFISGTPPSSGEYLISAFRYTPVDQKVTLYTAWPVVILDRDNRLEFAGKSIPYQYDLMSGEDVDLAFENTSEVHNLSYIIIRNGENYDVRTDVNMSALEDLSDKSGMNAILSGNPFLTILQASGASGSGLQKVISYSITRQGSPPPEQPPEYNEINITPGYGISGYARNTSYVVIGQSDLATLIDGSFSVYALALDKKNDIVALDQGTLLVGSEPNASFTVQPTGGQAPLLVQFTDTSSHNPSSWNWDFGDGTPTDTIRNPSHVYQNTGIYTVSVTASNSFGSSTTTKSNCINVTVPRLRADFTGNPTTGYNPLVVQFNDTSPGPHDTWDWDFGDGSSSAEQHPVHTFSQIRAYNVTLTVSSASFSDTLTRSSYISVFSRGGGGGGGGGGYFFNPPINTTSTPSPIPTRAHPGGLPLGLDNRTTQAVVITSPDGLATLSLATGVAVSSADGGTVAVLTLDQVAEGLLPQLPSEYITLPGVTYTISPQGTVFDPGANLNITLSRDDWATLAGKDVVIGRYDTGSGSWLPLTTHIDAAGKTVNADVRKCGTYGLVIRRQVSAVDTTVPVTTTTTTTVLNRTSPPPVSAFPWTMIIAAFVVVVIVTGFVAFYFIRVRKGKPHDK